MKRGTLALVFVFLLASACTAKEIVVTSTADAGQGTLRWGLQTARLGDVITFDASAFPTEAPSTIYLQSQLTITRQGITIDASSAGVILDGSRIPLVNGFNYGLLIPSDNNIVMGLQIVNVSGAGIGISGGHNMIGGARSIGTGPIGQGNLLSGNGMGIDLWGAGRDNIILGNLVGIQADGVTPWGNDCRGIWVEDGSSGTRVGPENVVAFNGCAGVEVSGTGAYGITITRNSIYDNSGTDILVWDRANRGLEPPEVTLVDGQGGVVQGLSCAGCLVEIYSATAEGSLVFEGQATADSSGRFLHEIGGPLESQQILATATDGEGNTSSYCRGSSSTEPAFLEGNRYTVPVPDTLDLQARANLLVRAIAASTEPTARYAVYESPDLWCKPPVMRGPIQFSGKYTEGLLLARLITGNLDNFEVDRTWREDLLSQICAQGTALVHGIDGGRLLAWFARYYEAAQDPLLDPLVECVLENLTEGIVWQDEYCYFPDGDGGMPVGWEGTYDGWTLQGLVQLCRVTGDEDMLKIAEGLARYLKDHARVLGESGEFLARQGSELRNSLHFHHNANALVAVAEYAALTGDLEYADLATRGYEWARALGSPVTGFFPEYIGNPPDDRTEVTCETCCTADMILLALLLSTGTEADYWDDVDRYLRNQFAEMQMLDAEWVKGLTAIAPKEPLLPGETREDVAQRCIGTFASWASLNDFYGLVGTEGTTFCCTGNATRAIYFVWERMLEYEDGVLRIHLLLNRASEWADIDSYIPYEGRVDIRVKVGCALEVRLPEWAKIAEATCAINGVGHELAIQDRYVILPHTDEGDLVTLAFAIPERSVRESVGGERYELLVRGNTVVSVSPSGKWYPLYQRAAYRGPVQWVLRERFVLGEDAVGDVFGRPEELQTQDRDGDGVPDDEDWCPDYPGSELMHGC